MQGEGILDDFWVGWQATWKQRYRRGHMTGQMEWSGEWSWERSWRLCKVVDKLVNWALQNFRLVWYWLGLVGVQMVSVL